MMTRGHDCVAEPPSPSISTDSEYDYLFKLVVIGDTGVGKSSLLMRFVDDSFVDSHIATIGVDFKIKTINIDQKVVKLQVWDTAGQERFRTITSSFYRGAHGVLLVYDVTEPKTFESIKSWMNEVDLCANERTRRLMVGNKCDMIDRKQVAYDTAKELADRMNFPLIETSAKTSTNVEQAFVLMAADMMDMTDKHKMDPLTPTLRIGEGKPAEKKKGFLDCCS